MCVVCYVRVVCVCVDVYPSQFYGVYSENIGHTIHLEVLFVVVGVCV